MKVLWENSNPSSPFTSKEVTVAELDNYDGYEILFFDYLTNDAVYNTGFIPNGHECNVQMFAYNGAGNRLLLFQRRVDYHNNAQPALYFNDSHTFIVMTSTASESVDNNNLIPYQIIGYKL